MRFRVSLRPLKNKFTGVNKLDLQESTPAAKKSKIGKTSAADSERCMKPSLVHARGCLQGPP
jgi:hypothetical protein